MIKVNKLFSIILILFTSLSLFSTIVLAHEGEDEEGTKTITPTTTKVLKTNIEVSRTVSVQKIEKTETLKPNTFKDRCSVIEKNSDDISGKFNRGKEENVKIFDKTITSLETLSTKLKERSVNTSALDSEITVLKQKIQKYNSDVKVLIDYLSTLKKEICTNTTTLTLPPLKTNVESKSTKVRQLMTILKSDMDDIKNYFKNTIRPTLNDLKKSIKDTQTPTISTTRI